MHALDPITRAVSLVRRGDFVGVATDPELLNRLGAIGAGDYVPKNLEWLSSRAILAEVNDQTGQYQKVADIYSNWNEVNIVRKNLLRAREERLAGRSTGPPSDTERRVLRAMAFYVLEAGILRLRRFELDTAFNIMSECEETMESLSSDECHFHGVLSLLHYWQGRVEMARNRMPQAFDHFKASMRQTEKNLNFHYSGASPGVKPGDQRIAYATYSLASCMAFGVAHLNHVSGNLTQALDLLRPASAMLMGTGDNYRRGYAQMLIGAAERALAGRDAIRLQEAIKTLKESFDLFAGDAKHQLDHRLHQARVSHQLALAHTYLAQVKGSVSRESLLTQASSHCDFASSVLSDFEEAGFGDPELRYDLSITRSRIFRVQRRYEQARAAASNALRKAQDYTYAPEYSQGKALIARAETFLAELDEQKGNPVLLDRAENDLRDALKTSDSNLVMGAVAHLYAAKIFVKRGQLHQARKELYEGWHRHEKQIQNGWVRQLAKEVEIEVQQPSAEFTLNFDHLEDEIASVSIEGGPRDKLWDVAVHRIKDFMIEWAKKSTPHTPWVRLGLSRAAYFQNKRSFGDESGQDFELPKSS
jgi:hypothetical protein